MVAENYHKKIIKNSLNYNKNKFETEISQFISSEMK